MRVGFEEKVIKMRTTNKPELVILDGTFTSIPAETASVDLVVAAQV